MKVQKCLLKNRYWVKLNKNKQTITKIRSYLKAKLEVAHY